MDEAIVRAHLGEMRAVDDAQRAARILREKGLTKVATLEDRENNQGAVAIARNQGTSLDQLTTVNMDFTRLYRPQTNVVSRPVAGIGKGYSLVGHHEIMVPLLAAALIEE